MYGSTAADGAVEQSSGGTAVLPAPPTNTSAPSISGAPALGQTLTANVGSWSAPPDAPTAYTYQWESCSLVCMPIAGATGATYALTDSSVGAQLAVVVGASDAGGPGTAVSSPRTGTVTAPTTLGLVVSPLTPGADQPVDLVGAVTSGADTVFPNGTLTFSANGQAIAGCSGLKVSGAGLGVTVACQARFAVSSPKIAAAFTPAAGSPLLGASAPAQTITVSRGASRVTLDVPAEATRGASLTYTASVSPGMNRTGPAVPGGAVAFLDHGQAIAGCAKVAVRQGGATCTARYEQSGSHSIAARYLGDANFRASGSHASGVRIVAPQPRRKPEPEPKPGRRHVSKPLGAITATMRWTFHYTPDYTRILALAIDGARAGSKVTMRCQGKGCPFKTRSRPIGPRRPCPARRHHACPAPGSVDLESSFAHRRLDVHTTVVVTISRPRYVAKFYRFTIRARREPKILISCLAIGSDRPGVGCSAH